MTTVHFLKAHRAAARKATLLAAAIGFVALAATGAQAFTFNDQPNDGTGTGTKFSDPADRAKALPATAATGPRSRAATRRCSSAAASRSTSALVRTAISTPTL